MLATAAPYLVALSAMAFAGISALTLIHTVSHLDPPDATSSATPVRPQVDVRETVAV